MLPNISESLYMRNAVYEKFRSVSIYSLLAKTKTQFLLCAIKHYNISKRMLLQFVVKITIQLTSLLKGET